MLKTQNGAMTSKMELQVRVNVGYRCLPFCDFTILCFNMPSWGGYKKKHIIYGAFAESVPLKID